MTAAELTLWQALRRGHAGARFRRQVVIDRFIVDFCAYSARLVVEVDGDVHHGREEFDAARERQLRALGFRVLRFTNAQVMSSIDAVVLEIEASLCARPLR